MEVSIFNCPQWGMGVSSITVANGGSTLAVLNTHSSPSCSSLITACTEQISTTNSILNLRFQLSQSSTWLLVAEIKFYSLIKPRSCQISEQTCGRFEMIPASSENTTTQPSFSTSKYPTTSYSISHSISTTEEELGTTSEPHCSLFPSYIVLAMAIVFSCVLTSIVSVPLTALITRKHCSTRTTTNQTLGLNPTLEQDKISTGEKSLELKEQVDSENEVLNHIYAPVNVTSHAVEVTQNESYNVLKGRNN